MLMLELVSLAMLATSVSSVSSLSWGAGMEAGMGRVTSDSREREGTLSAGGCTTTAGDGVVRGVAIGVAMGVEVGEVIGDVSEGVPDGVEVKEAPLVLASSTGGADPDYHYMLISSWQ